MPYLFLALLAGLVFLICWGVDNLIKKLFPKHSQEELGKAVRLPRYGAIVGIFMTFIAFVAELFYFSQLEWYLHIACVFSLGMGVFLLVQYCTFGIFYDEEGFVYRQMRKKAKFYRYGDILGQKSILTRSGVHATLYLKDGEIIVYSAMKGLNEFLKFAFARWCEEKDIDPDTVENNPQYLTYFPEYP
jgi:hypothetical protein